MVASSTPWFARSLLTLALAGLLVLLYILGISQKLDDLSLDLFFRLRGPAAPGQDILIVAIDEAFVKEYPFRIGELDRGFYAQALNHLKQAGARAIGVDIFFPERSRTGISATRDPDFELAQAISQPNIVLPTLRNPDGSLLPAHPWLKDVKLGVLTLEESARSFTPVISWQGQSLPSFALAIIRAAQLETRHPLTRTLHINYRGPAGQFRTLSFLDVYRNQFSYSQVQGKIVLLGVTLKGTDRDQILTPFGEMPGVEVNANEVYTLLYSHLRVIPTWLYSLLLLSLGVLTPPVVRRKTGLWYALTLMVGLGILSFLLFLVEIFVPPLALSFIPLAAYLQGSYTHLLKLDQQISVNLLRLLDSAANNTQLNRTEKSLARGFAPSGNALYAPELLESLMVGLNAEGGILILNKVRHQKGRIDSHLEQVLNQAINRQLAQSQGTMPHYLAEPLLLEGQIIGVVAFMLPAPPPPHLLSLLHISVQTSSQLAKYQKLRDQTTTLTGTLWPWGSRSSLDKLAALTMIGDLLATERRWLGTLVESLPQAVFIMSPYGYSIYRNEAARRLFSDEKNILSAIPESIRVDPERFRQDYTLLVERGEELELGLTKRNNGQPVLLTLRVVRNESTLQGVVGVISDLSKVEELNRQRQDLMGMIIHDLRSPLTSIQGFAEIMLTGQTKPEYLKIIKSESERMHRMTDAFLDVVRLESGEISLHLGQHNLADLLRYAVASVSAQVVEKNSLIEVRAPAYLPIQADADLIHRLIINLLSNAIKYSPPDKRIIVSLNQQADQVILSIKDEGYGLSLQQQQNLFEKFQRGDNENARRQTGSGLGLYVVKLITDLHHGTIAVDSVLHQGTTITITLPSLQPPESIAGQVKKNPLMNA